MTHPKKFLQKYYNTFLARPTLQPIFMQVVYDIWERHSIGDSFIIGTVDQWINSQLLEGNNRPMNPDNALHTFLNYLLHDYTVLMIAETQIHAPENTQYIVYLQKDSVPFHPDGKIPYEINLMQHILKNPKDVMIFASVII